MVVVTWGFAGWGGDSLSVAEQLSAKHHRSFRNASSNACARKKKFVCFSSRFSLIFMKFARIFSDFHENAEKRCNFSKFIDFNLIFIMIIPEIYLIFDLIFDLVFDFFSNFRFHFHRAVPSRDLVMDTRSFTFRFKQAGKGFTFVGSQSL